MHSMLWLPLLPNTLSFPILFTRMVAHFYLNLLKSYLAFKDSSKAIICLHKMPSVVTEIFKEIFQILKSI